MRTWILISGKQGAGKTTLATNISTRLHDLGFTVQRASLADPIRAAASQAILSLKTNPTSDQYGRLLQLLGQWGREISEDFWIDRLVTRVYSLGMSPNYTIIDDVRFPNEIDKLKISPDDIAIKIRLWAPEHEREKRAAKWRPTDHPSETGMDNYPLNNYDAVIGTDITTKTETCEMLLNMLALRNNALRVRIQQERLSEATQ